MIEVTISPTRIQAGAVTGLEIRLTNRGPGSCTNIVLSIRLPNGLVQLGGKGKIHRNALAPGERFSSPIRVRASTPGRYQLRSPNFSYEDHRGQVQHTTDFFIAEISVEPEPVAAPAPRLSAELLTTALPLGRWDALRGRVTNVGESDVRDLEVILSGQVVTDERDNRCSVERLTAGASVDLEFQARALEAGDRVPVYFDLSYRGPDGSHQGKAKHTIRVDSAETITTPDRSSAPPDPAGPAI
jgi:hypothetical protein